MRKKVTTVTMPMEEYEKMKQDLSDTTATVMAIQHVNANLHADLVRLDQENQEIKRKYGAALQTIKQMKRIARSL